MNFSRLPLRKLPVFPISSLQNGGQPVKMQVRQLNMPGLRQDTKERISQLTLPFLLCTALGSFSVNLLWTKMEHQEYKEKVQLKIQLLEERIEQLQKGEPLMKAPVSSENANKLELPIVIPKAKTQLAEEKTYDPSKPRSFF
ncbi:hypothetical protein K493DRAFT_316033 [Basidiobolus meristosporus CBS 931.73]|uniref:Uncharacterized protein n=1 Tax=Basidiobolus meristosporus CBS 931.73 TaxID=1314790 RepID=A0A1Y1Y5U9_9FUNG|nr:hypothetical protein K493DRAFT_316033 [Basidiobolus meristosporus CBS 931.73]|eukprot:ORX93397.1 hypothetical protein K493DRAFT_316033 [Basidiobolus meristosporus CBS 931.73]